MRAAERVLWHSQRDSALHFFATRQLHPCPCRFASPETSPRRCVRRSDFSEVELRRLYGSRRQIIRIRSAGRKVPIRRGQQLTYQHLRQATQHFDGFSFLLRQQRSFTPTLPSCLSPTRASTGTRTLGVRDSVRIRRRTGFSLPRSSLL